MPKFAVGAKVRVKAGTTDPENPDLPIGLWCGDVEEVDDAETPPSYLVRWDERTCDFMPRIFINRCRAENLEIETMWLDEEQLEADNGEMLPLELPPDRSGLSSEEDDRNDDRPDVLPFPGSAELAIEETPRLPLGKLLGYCGLIGGIYGATLGAIAATFEETRFAMLIGAGAVALLLGIVGRRWGLIVGAMRGTRNGAVLGMVLGLGVGGMLGVLLGALAVAFVGSITGSIAGTLLSDGLARKWRRPGVKFLGALLGACIGGVVLAITQNREAAQMGALVGGLIGIVGGLFLVLAALVTLIALVSRRH